VSKGSIVVIESVPYIQRANHYHKEDYHYCYVVEGSITYYEREAGSKVPLRRFEFKKGDMFYTPPMMEHCMFFKEKTVFIAMGGKTRSQKEYEEDLVRLPSLHDEYLHSFTKEI